jgi:hypothetical protein
VKSLEGQSPSERDAQFRYINAQVKGFLRRRAPVLSVGYQEKGRVGAFKNSGTTWRPKGEPLEVNVYDYPHLGLARPSPMGPMT